MICLLKVIQSLIQQIKQNLVETQVLPVWGRHHQDGSGWTARWRWSLPGWTHRGCSSQWVQTCVAPARWCGGRQHCTAWASTWACCCTPVAPDVKTTSPYSLTMEKEKWEEQMDSWLASRIGKYKPNHKIQFSTAWDSTWVCCCPPVTADVETTSPYSLTTENNNNKQEEQWSADAHPQGVSTNQIIRFDAVQHDHLHGYVSVLQLLLLFTWHQLSLIMAQEWEERVISLLASQNEEVQSK